MNDNNVAAIADINHRNNLDAIIEDSLDFILDHFQPPIFPRKIMTKGIGYQLEVFDKQPVLNYFKSSNYADCRINAYPSYTNYHGINRVAPTFIMIDLDLKDFDYSKEKIGRALQNTSKKIKQVIGGYPTVLWTGNGYHIYQPMKGFILEEEEVFAKFTIDCNNNNKDLTSRFMQFAEEFFTDKKKDAQHNPTVKSCLLRIPYTLNSKCKGEEMRSGQVTIIQKWDGNRPPINYLLRDFRRYLINERINEVQRQKQSKNHSLDRSRSSNNIVPWIEKLIQTPIEDHRKFAVWRILAPYLINIKKLSYNEAFSIIKDWLNKCGTLRMLDFIPDYLIKYNLNNAKRIGYLPISIDKLNIENKQLYHMINENKNLIIHKDRNK
jgi:hypothetical protein